MVFSYKATSYEGVTTTGTIEADTKAEATGILKAKKLIPSYVKPAKANVAKMEIVLFRPKANRKEMVFMLKNLSTMLRAGIPIMQALDIIQGQIKQKSLRLAAKQMRIDLTNGLLLSESIKKTKIFPDLVPAIVRVGEEAGSLDKSFLQLSDYYLKDMKTRGKIVGALIYPVITFIAAIGATWFLTTNVLPTILGSIDTSNVGILTQILLDVSEFFKEQGATPIIALFVVLIVIGQLGMTVFKKQRDWILINLPLYGKVIRKTKAAQFTNTLSILTDAGVTITNSLDIISQIIGNQIYISNIKKVKAGVVNGELISKNLSIPLFDKLVVTIIAIGESTGDMQKPLDDVSEYLNEEVERNVDALVSMITPLSILLIASLVAVIVIGVMGPMFSMYENI